MNQDIGRAMQRFIDAANSLERDLASETPVCVGLQTDLGVPFSPPDLDLLPEAAREIVEPMIENGDDVRDFAPEHIQFHMLMHSILNDAYRATDGDIQQWGVLLLSLGRRVGLMEAAETFATSGLGDGPLLPPSETA